MVCRDGGDSILDKEVPLFKLMFLGGNFVGKTSIIQQYLVGKLTPIQVSGVEFLNKVV